MPRTTTSDEPAHYDERVLDALQMDMGQVEALRDELAAYIVDEIKGMVEQCL